MNTLKLDLTKHFKNATLGISFAANTNRVVLFGPSGSGKSLILKMIAGFFNPEHGEIAVKDKLLFSTYQKIDLPIFERNIGYLPQEYTLFPNMTVEKNILYGLKTRQVPFKSESLQKLIDRLEIGSLLNCNPKNLSGGQKQRAALARILMINPCILLLDEPFSALDTPIRESLRDLVIEIADEMNITVLFVTHDIEEAFVFGKEVVLVHKGKVIEYGARDQIFNRPAFVETSRLLGFINIWPIEKIDGNRAEIAKGIVFSFKGNCPPDVEFLCIRPENIMLLREEKPYKNRLRENIVGGVIKSIHHRGRYVQIKFKGFNDLSLTINMPEHAFNKLKLTVGKEIKVSLKEESVVLCRKFEKVRLIVQRLQTKGSEYV